MKKIIYILSLSLITTLDIDAQTYGAGVRVEDLYWYNHPLHNGTVEWVCTTKAVLYFGDEEVVPSPEHSYVWFKNPAGTWVVAGTNYFITPDGNPGQYYQVKVQISGPGFSVTSQPFTIGLSGEVQLLEIKAKLQNGSSLANSYSYFQNFTDPHWRQGRFDVVTQKDVLNLTKNENSLIRINPYYLTAYNEKFNRWNSADQFINYDGFYIDNSFTLLNGNFKQRVNNVVIQANTPEYPGFEGSLIGFKDPWLMEFVSENLGLQNKGDQAAFKYYNSINFSDQEFDSYKGVFLNQNPTFDPTIPNYSVKVNSPQDINLGGQIGTRKFYSQGWDYDPSKITLQSPNLNESGIVFKTSDAEISADFKGQGLSNSRTTARENS